MASEINFIEQIYFAYLEDQLFCMFPGGSMQLNVSDKYQPVKRPWFKNVVEVVNSAGIAYGEDYDFIYTV